MDNASMMGMQQQAKKAAFSTGLPMRALIFSAVAFALSLMVYAGLEYGYKTFLTADIASIKEQTDALDVRAPSEETSKNFLVFYSAATNMQKLLDGHVAVSPVFDFIERLTYPNVSYSTLRISPPDRSVTFDGKAAAYDRLAEQFSLFERAPETTKSAVSGSRFVEGKIQFEGNMFMNDDVFSFVKSTVVTPAVTETPSTSSGQAPSTDSTGSPQAGSGQAPSTSSGQAGQPVQIQP